MYGAIEAGGTKFICAIGDETGHIHHQERLPTTDPATTLGKMLAFLIQGRDRFGELRGIGLASFGPIEVDSGSPRYGTLGRTPKRGWSGTDMLSALRREFSCPLVVDTDVNAAGLAEHRWGAARDVGNLAYVTVGTGIGGGLIVDGRPVHGLMHPEIGHIYPRRHRADIVFTGVCPFHHDCLEGLASGAAILNRSGAPLSHLAPNHMQWEMEADYLGQLCAQLVVTMSPQRIIMGGGVMAQMALFPPIRVAMKKWLAGYVDRIELTDGVDRYIVPPGLGAQAGIMGALALALNARS